MLVVHRGNLHPNAGQNQAEILNAVPPPPPSWQERLLSDPTDGAAAEMAPLGSVAAEVPLSLFVLVLGSGVVAPSTIGLNPAVGRGKERTDGRSKRRERESEESQRQRRAESEQRASRRTETQREREMSERTGGEGGQDRSEGARCVSRTQQRQLAGAQHVRALAFGRCTANDPRPTVPAPLPRVFATAGWLAISCRFFGGRRRLPVGGQRPWLSLSQAALRAIICRSKTEKRAASAVRLAPLYQSLGREAVVALREQRTAKLLSALKGPPARSRRCLFLLLFSCKLIVCCCLACISGSLGSPG